MHGLLLHRVRCWIQQHDDRGAGVYSAGGGGERVGAEPRLTFTVPPHRQKSFLEEGAAQDMVVG